MSSTTHLGWTMIKWTGIDNPASALLLLLVVLVLFSVLRISRRPDPLLFPERNTTFVQIAGQVRNPGVFAFPRRPSLEELTRKAGINLPISNEADFAGFRFPSGEKILLTRQENSLRVERGQITPFHKVTLGIPVSLNLESPEGLTALPGIGPWLAKAIVEKRKKMKGFSTVEELLSVPGVGQRLFRKIRHHVKP